MPLSNSELDELKKQSKYLDCDTLFLIQHCIDNQLHKLERMHWEILPFLPHSGGNEPLFNLAKMRTKLEKAKSTISEIYVSQFGK